VITEAYAAMISQRLDDADDAIHVDSRRDLAALSRTVARTRLLLEALLQDARSVDHIPVRRPVELAALVAGCVETLQVEIDARDARLHVGELPTVEGDESLLNGLFTNLLMNALKYSPREGAEISVQSSLDGTAWEISVDSEGPVIPPDDRKRIFEPFQRGTGERRARGAGLGLAICRRIVERHGGVIGVVPSPSGGNRFFFTLPA
jgi:signal transduction histidine kinase